MSEKPILFSGEMVRAILDGRKTQTRRALKVQPLDILPMNVPNQWATLRERAPNHGDVIKCRFGVPGDRLWVRETFCVGFDNEQSWHYRATDPNPAEFSRMGWKWKPSIFMPRAASRITLEIVDVRVERLQEISEGDCFAEGIKPIECLDCDALILTHRAGDSHYDDPIPAYKSLWERINGAGSWALNPWVWVVEFKQ